MPELRHCHQQADGLLRAEPAEGRTRSPCLSGGTCQALKRSGLLIGEECYIFRENFAGLCARLLGLFLLAVRKSLQGEGALQL